MDIVSKVLEQAALILRTFTSRDVN